MTPPQRILSRLDPIFTSQLRQEVKLDRATVLNQANRIKVSEFNRHADGFDRSGYSDMRPLVPCRRNCNSPSRMLTSELESTVGRLHLCLIEMAIVFCGF